MSIYTILRLKFANILGSNNLEYTQRIELHLKKNQQHTCIHFLVFCLAVFGFLNECKVDMSTQLRGSSWGLGGSVVADVLAGQA